MTILVTGGAGFIGTNFVRYWASRYPDDNIIVYDKLTYAGNFENIGDLVEAGKIQFVKGDICNKELLDFVVVKYKVDTIVHFAAESHVDRSIDSPGEFIQTNIVGTWTILEIVRKYDLRFHHISTDEVFGELPIDNLDIKFKESTPYDPRSPYSASKASSDHLVRSYVNTYSIKATISNCSNNYGPYCFPEKLIPLVITRAIYNEKIPVYGDGKQRRDWIYVEDHVRGIDLILRHGKIGETYLLGGDGERENIWIVNKILDILSKPKDLIVHVGDRKGHDKRYSIDYSKAKVELGFEPSRDIEDGLKQTVNWYIENREWWEKLKEKADIIANKYLNTTDKN
ncbi:MAG: dTDP-glucose 4,6-dehydratase [Candidatus Dojkabacteria bacterium]|nr:dTDP-glucose 4,6-dehydratase [Candidatus Dojkabacteria bacterium]